MRFFKSDQSVRGGSDLSARNVIAASDRLVFLPRHQVASPIVLKSSLL